MKSKFLRATLTKKLARVFTEWLNSGTIPGYLAKSKLILLSKENSSYPTVGSCRPISILPILDKVLQKIIHSRLTDGPEQHRPLCESQIGFTRGKSTVDNIHKLNSILSGRMDLLQMERSNRVRNDLRSKIYLLFVDWSSAYDTVHRGSLLTKC